MVNHHGHRSGPESFLYLRLDKDNYLQIIAAIEGQTGVRVERLESE